MSWPRSVACVSDHPGDSHGALSETGLTRYLEVIRAPRESIQAHGGWTVHAKEPFKVLLNAGHPHTFQTDRLHLISNYCIMIKLHQLPLAACMVQ